MLDRAAMPGSRFQFGLRHLFVWITAVAVVCGLALAWTDHLRYVEAKDGLIPPQTVGLSMLLAFVLLTALLGLIVGPPLCLLLSFVHSRRHNRD